MDGVLRFASLGWGSFLFSVLLRSSDGLVLFIYYLHSFLSSFFLFFPSRSCMEHDGMKETKITLQTGNMAYTNWGGEKKGGHVLFCLLRCYCSWHTYSGSLLQDHCFMYTTTESTGHMFFQHYLRKSLLYDLLFSPYLLAYLQSIRCYTASHEILLAAHLSPCSLQSPLPHHMEPCCTLFSTCCLQSPLPSHMKLGRSMCRGKMRDTHAWMYVYRAQWRKWTTLSAESSFSR